MIKKEDITYGSSFSDVVEVCNNKTGLIMWLDRVLQNRWIDYGYFPYCNETYSWRCPRYETLCAKTDDLQIFNLGVIAKVLDFKSVFVEFFGSNKEEQYNSRKVGFYLDISDFGTVFIFELLWKYEFEEFCKNTGIDMDWNVESVGPTVYYDKQKGEVNVVEPER